MKVRAIDIIMFQRSKENESLEIVMEDIYNYDYNELIREYDESFKTLAEIWGKSPKQIEKEFTNWIKERKGE